MDPVLIRSRKSGSGYNLIRYLIFLNFVQRFFIAHIYTLRMNNHCCCQKRLEKVTGMIRIKIKWIRFKFVQKKIWILLQAILTFVQRLFIISVYTLRMNNRCFCQKRLEKVLVTLMIRIKIKWIQFKFGQENPDPVITW